MYNEEHEIMPPPGMRRMHPLRVWDDVRSKEIPLGRANGSSSMLPPAARGSFTNTLQNALKKTKFYRLVSYKAHEQRLLGCGRRPSFEKPPLDPAKLFIHGQPGLNGFYHCATMESLLIGRPRRGPGPHNFNMDGYAYESNRKRDI
jgi:hypothetical protein